MPAQLKVFVIDGTTGLATTIYPTEYEVDWINEVVILDNPINISDKLRIEVYQVGNGDQLVKANTKTNPIRLTNIGFSQIYLDCNYRAPIYSGSGVIRPGSDPIEVFATESSSINNTITVEDVSELVINAPIRFSGNVFGGVVEDTVYYIKTISYAQSKITISDQFNVLAGIAGPTLPLTDGSGLMDVIIQLGIGTTWTAPIIYHNGNKLIPGHLMTVTRTRSSTNSVTCNTTNGLIVGEKIVFSNTMFETSGLEIGKIYYIQSIVDNNEFTVSDTIGGPALALNDATGGASCIVNDYAFGIQENGTSATLILSGKDVAGYAIPYDQALPNH